MRRAVRFIAIGIVLVHGLVHLMGAAKGFGWIDVSALKQPIGTAAAFAWLVAAILVVCSAALLAFGVRWWWIIGAVGAVASQAMIVTSWRDAKAGSIANAILLLAALHGFLAEGPPSLRSRYRQLAALRRPAVVGATAPLVTEGGLARLPASVARYVAASGAVGQPRVHGFCALFHGRIRPAADKPWMHFTGEQVNTYGRAPSRLFSMDATMAGIPVDVLHEYSGTSATMRVKACSAITMVDASGPEMDQAETVTMVDADQRVSPIRQASYRRNGRSPLVPERGNGGLRLSRVLRGRHHLRRIVVRRERRVGSRRRHCTATVIAVATGRELTGGCHEPNNSSR